MKQDCYYKINTPKIVYEVFDNEVVIVNFDTGAYYSLEKTGYDIWRLIEQNAPMAALIDWCKRRYKTESVDIENPIGTFLADLEKEGLISSSTQETDTELMRSHSVSDTGSTQAHLKFEPPALHKYSDMQQMLLLDPTHDVDQKGWPSKKKDMPTGT